MQEDPAHIGWHHCLGRWDGLVVVVAAVVVIP